MQKQAHFKQTLARLMLHEAGVSSKNKDGKRMIYDLNPALMGKVWHDGNFSYIVCRSFVFRFQKGIVDGYTFPAFWDDTTREGIDNYNFNATETFMKFVTQATNYVGKVYVGDFLKEVLDTVGEVKLNKADFKENADYYVGLSFEPKSFSVKKAGSTKGIHSAYLATALKFMQELDGSSAVVKVTFGKNLLVLESESLKVVLPGYPKGEA